MMKKLTFTRLIRHGRTPQKLRPVWASVSLGAVLAAAVAGAALWPSRVEANFTGGPSVRVSPNVKFEISYVADFVGHGTVQIFDNAEGTGAALATELTGSPKNDHTFVFFVDGIGIKADTQYFFRISHRDPSGGVPTEVTQPPLPPVFTGAQTIGDVFVDAGSDRARILWDANVIGTGRVDYGTSSPDELSIEVQQNTTSHTIEIAGLLPGTTYQFRVSNRHAIDGDSLAAKTGSFTTQATPPQIVQAIDDLRERVASYGLQRGPARSLDAKLEASLAAWQAGDTAGACGALSDFLNEVRAQAGKKLSEAQAQQLTAAASDIRALIGC